MKKKKIIILILILMCIAGVVAWMMLSKGMRYNEDGAIGNTNGNIYNGGLFCEYNGDVYFSNPNDDESLYKMDMEGETFEKLYGSSVSYINIYNDYIYFKKYNTNTKNVLQSRSRYGICRMEIGDTIVETLHNGKIDGMTLCGNYIYYRNYNDDKVFSLYKVKIDGEEDEKLSDEAYLPLAVSNKKIYFANIKENHHLMVLDTQDDSIYKIATGNFYMPDIYNDNLYFVDCDNNRKLTCMNLKSYEKTVLTDDSVINYNLNGEYGVIFYQAENTRDNHGLYRIDTKGENKTLIANGDYCNISVTHKYTYFYQIVGGDKVLLRTNTLGDASIMVFDPPVLDK